MRLQTKLNVLHFIRQHPGTRRKAFPCGYRFDFTAPEYKRSPFRIGTLYQLIDEGLVTESGPVVLTALGETLLRQYRPTALEQPRAPQDRKNDDGANDDSDGQAKD